MSPVVSPAIALLQQLEALLRDPAVGPRVAQHVASVMASIIDEGRVKADKPADKPDADAYARLWIPAWDDDAAAGQQAWISLASI